MIEKIELTNPVSGNARAGFVCAPETPKAVMAITHGFGEHSGRYHPMAEHMAAQNIAVISLDLEGHGQLTSKQGVVKSYDVFHADVTLLLEEARSRFPETPVFLYGHSMGGGLVLNHGLKKAPAVSGYLVSAPLIIPADPVPGPLRTIVKLLRPLLPNMTIKNTVPGEYVSSIPEEQSRYENDPYNHGRLGLGLAVDIIEGGEWVGENAKNWEAPLLLIHARADKLTQFEATEKFAAKAQNCTFMAMKNCEHEMHNDVVREEVYAAMIEFIEARL